MYSHKIYIVTSARNILGVKVEDTFDGNLFTIDSIVAGYKKKFKDVNHQISIVGDNAYIDIIDDNDELIKTYSIISKNVMLKKD